MRLVFYDFEFLEDGHTIDPISVGMVDNTGRELYAVNRDAPWRKIRKNDWLMRNVVSQLPKVYGDARNHQPKSWLFNMADPAVMSRNSMAAEVRIFLTAPGVPIELWADHGAYDHVALAQLFGRMVDLPAGIPMFTNDIAQEIARRGVQPPAQALGVHNALEDARHVRATHLWLSTAGPEDTP